MNLLSDNYETSESIKEVFLKQFQLLTPKQQKIWRYLRDYSISWRNVMPSQSDIAKEIGCCRDTVIKSIKLFENRKWISSLNRPYNTKIYFLNEILTLIKPSEYSLGGKK